MAIWGKMRALVSYLICNAVLIVLLLIPYCVFTQRLPDRSTVIAMAIGAAFSPAFYWMLWRVFGWSPLGERRTTKRPDVR